MSAELIAYGLNLALEEVMLLQEEYARYPDTRIFDPKSVLANVFDKLEQAQQRALVLTEDQIDKI